jgi:hypothetical protein
MFYRWAKRLETMQLPATAFPAAAADPTETEESHELDGALVAAAIASLWVLLQTFRWAPDASVSFERAVIAYGPIFLVGVLAALLLRPQTSIWSIAGHVVALGAIATLMGVMWAHSAGEIIIWGAFFALLGLVTGVFFLVVWAVTLRLLTTPQTMLFNNATAFRALCVVTILIAAITGAHKAVSIPFAGN